MARKIGAGVFEIVYVSTITAAATPTPAEISAGVDLTGFLTDGGFDSPLDGSVSDAADMGSAFNKTQLGTFGGQELTAEFFRDDASDTAWDTLPRGTTGWFVIGRLGIATPGTFKVGDDVDIWPIAVASRNPVAVARAVTQRFMVSCAVPGVPTESYTLA